MTQSSCSVAVFRSMFSTQSLVSMQILLRRVLRAIRSPDPLTVEVVTLQCESAWCARKTAECREGNPFLCDGFCVSLCAYGVMLALLDSVSVAELVKFVFVLSLLRD